MAERRGIAMDNKKILRIAGKLLWLRKEDQRSYTLEQLAKLIDVSVKDLEEFERLTRQ